MLVLRASVWLTCVLMVALAHAATDERERLEKIRSEIEAREALAREFASEAKGYLGELEAIDRELAETRKSLVRLRKRRGAAEEEREAHEETKQNTGKSERALRKRLQLAVSGTVGHGAAMSMDEAAAQAQ